jgi:hypothetical protein
MSSAWLIRRYVDTDAKFGFVADCNEAPKHAVPFDMFGVEFSHQGELCAFETLIETFGVGGDAVARIAGIVHDLDLKEEKFSAPEAPTVATMIEGLRAMHADDGVLLEEGIKMFESLFRAFEQTNRPPTGSSGR